MAKVRLAAVQERPDYKDLPERQYQDEEWIKALVDALRPFAALYQSHHQRMFLSTPMFAINDQVITVGDLRRAAELIESVSKIESLAAGHGE